MSKSIPFCVAGMHRSGTSLIAGWLYNSGVFMGKSLLEGASSNPKGHFEDKEILEFHSRILEREGFHRSGLTINHNNFEFNSKEKVIAQNIINERSGHELWSWKEPRSTLFLNSWKRLIPDLKVVGIYRRPDLVIESLYKRLKRNKWYHTRNPLKRLKWYLDIDLNKSKWIKTFSKTYSIYNESLLEYQSKYPSEIILFDINDIIAEPKLFENKINSFLNTELQMLPFNEIYENAFIQKNSKELKGSISKEAANIYNQLRNSSM